MKFDGDAIADLQFGSANHRLSIQSGKRDATHHHKQHPASGSYHSHQASSTGLPHTLVTLQSLLVYVSQIDHAVWNQTSSHLLLLILADSSSRPDPEGFPSFCLPQRCSWKIDIERSHEHLAQAPGIWVPFQTPVLTSRGAVVWLRVAFQAPALLPQLSPSNSLIPEGTSYTEIFGTTSASCHFVRSPSSLPPLERNQPNNRPSHCPFRVPISALFIALSGRIPLVCSSSSP